jgi:hypothetical protein
MKGSTRRSFPGTAAAAPAILGAADKSGTRNPIVGEGAWKFEAIHDWGELPAGLKYGNTHGVVEDSHGRIYVHHTVHNASESHDTTVIFDEKGKFIKSWGKDFRGGAHGVHISINQYNSKGEYIRTFGGPGKEPGQLSCPHGIIVDTRGKEPVLTVADRSNNRLQHFSLDGKHIGFTTAQQITAPCHFQTRKGKTVIPDLDARVVVVDEKNAVIATLGDAGDAKEARKLRTQPRDAFQPGKFIARTARLSTIRATSSSSSGWKWIA